MAIECRTEMLEEHKKKITTALADIRQRVEQNKSKLPSDLFEELQKFFNSEARPKVEVFVSGATAGTWAESGGYSVWINPKCFEATDSRPGVSRLAAELFHEFVHLANGNELDCEYFENRICSAGATPPTMDDWEKFKAVDFQGWWVSLDHPASLDAKEPATVIEKWKQDPTEDRVLRMRKKRDTPPAPMVVPQRDHSDEADSARTPLTQRETTMSDYQEQLAQNKLEKLAATKDHLGVRINVEFTGHLHKDRIEVLLQKLKGVIVEDVDNGGGGM